MTPIPEVSISEVATRSDDIERRKPLSSVPAILLGKGFDRQDYADLFRHHRFTAAIRNYRLETYNLDTAAMTLIHEGKRIRETNYLVPPDYYDNACVLEMNLVKLEPGIDYIMARAFTNYYHWLIQSVPAVDWSLRNLQVAETALLSGHLNAWQADTLALFGHDQVPRVGLDPSTHYSIPVLHYSEFQNGSTAFHVSQSAQATFKRLAESAIDPSPAKADIIYVARTDTANRVAENEADIMDLLEEEGICVVVPGRLSVTQQINLFGKADAVIGPHGAGLTNIVFCRPQTIFYELLPEHYLNPCFTRLAQAADLNYMIDLFRSANGNNDDPHTRGWILDPDLMLTRVREIKLRLASRRPRSSFATNLPSSRNDQGSTGLRSTPAKDIKTHWGRKLKRLDPLRSWLSKMLSW